MKTKETAVEFSIRKLMVFTDSLKGETGLLKLGRRGDRLKS